MGIWKQVIPILTIIVLILAVLSFLGISPAQIGPTPGTNAIVVEDREGGTYLVGIVNGLISLNRTEYTVTEGVPLEYTISTVIITIDTTNYYENLVRATYTLDFGIILPGDTTPTPMPQLSISKSGNLQRTIEDIAFHDVYSGSIVVDSSVEFIEVDLIMTMNGFAVGYWPINYEMPIIGAPDSIGTFGASVDVIPDDPGPGPGPGPAQNFTVDGIVKTTRGSFITGATVRIGDHTTVTASGGRFNIIGIEEGAYIITVSQTGFKSYVNEISIAEDKSITITLLTLQEPPPPPDLDSDGDGFSDVVEIAAGTDPYDPNDFPGKNGDELPPFDWNIWVIILLIAAFVVAIAIFIMFGGGLMGGIFAAISFIVFAIAAWVAGSGILVSASIISLLAGG